MILQFAFSKRIPRMSKLDIVDCRQYMSNCFSRKAAIAHPGFERAVQDGIKILNRSGAVAIGCHQGRHRSVAVAEEISKRTGFSVSRLT